MKKALSLLLVLVLALSMSTVAFAATAKPKTLTQTGYNDIAAEIGVDVGALSIKQADIEVPLLETYFTWDGTAASPGNVKMQEIDKGKVKLTAKVKSGAVLFDKAVIEKGSNGMAQITVAYKDRFLVTSDSEVDLEVEFSLSVDGSKKNGTDNDNYNGPWVLTATYDPTDDVAAPESDDEGGDDISDGQLVKPNGYNPNWIAQLDGDDTIEGAFKLFKGRNFYIYAEGKVGDDDAETVDAYGFDQVYRLTYSANAVSSVKHINFTELGDGFYVYGSKSGAALKGKADVVKDLVYLGTSADDLPLYNRYYLAASQVDLDIDDIIDEPTIDAPIPADDGGGDGYIPNVNDNPGTGK